MTIIMIGLIQTEKSNINFFRQKREMKQNEFKDRLFDILNETNNLPIQDLIVDDKNDTVNVYLTDGTRFSIRIDNCGKWHLYNR